jgi:hypothetical protein
VTAILDDAPTPLAAPGTYPVPPGRGRWRLTLHRRDFNPINTTTIQALLISDLPRARSRKLVQAWCQPASLTFDVDGAAPEAALISELAHDVIAWRWDDTNGVDVPVFRGVVSGSQDQLDESAHVVTFTCLDYLALLARRYITNPAGVTWTSLDQDVLVTNLLNAATGATTGAGASLSPGSLFPLSWSMVNPGGYSRSASGQIVTRTYQAGQSIGQAIDELAKCGTPGGFDYAVIPNPGNYGNGWAAMADGFQIYYPSQGVTRTDVALVYGANVAKVQRQITSDDYGNYWYSLGNNQSASAGTAAFYADQANADASGTVVGLWADVDTGNADVILAATLQQRVAGDLNRMGVLIPTYTLTLRPGSWYLSGPGGAVRNGFANMGDTVPLVVKHGRLNVNTTVRVMGITYNIGDDGDENVDLVVGRPITTFADVLGGPASDVEALLRR